MRNRPQFPLADELRRPRRRCDRRRPSNTRARTRKSRAIYRVEVRQESIYEITEENIFDIAFSIGVIHHLEYPDVAIARIIRAVKPGGLILVWLYGRENNGWIVHFFNPVRRALFSRLPLGWVHVLSWPLAAGLWLMLRLGLQRIEYLRLIRNFSFDHLRAIVFDHMIPEIAHYYSREEAVALLRNAGIEEVSAVWVNEMSWSVMGRKPPGKRE